METLNTRHSTDADELCFLDDGGEVGALLQTTVMDGSPLGHPSQWSICLKNLIASALPVHAQIAIFWGPQFVALYNDAYAPSIGTKHPGALGRPAIENWGELWNDLEPLLRGVRETGKTFSAKDRPFYLKRYGAGETVYFDVSYSAVREADGSIGGVLCIVTETTERVQFERRQAFLLELGHTLPSTSDPALIEDHVLTRMREELCVRHIALIPLDDDGVALNVRQDHASDARQPAAQLPGWTDRMSADLRCDKAVLHEINASPIIPANTRMARYVQDEPPCTIYVPVVIHGKLEAVLSIVPSMTTTFGDHELDLAQDTARQAWLWINHARAERALHASSAQLAAMFAQASAGIAVCDPTWSFEQLNDRYCEIVGRPRDALLGARIQDIVTAGDRDIHLPGADYRITNGTSFQTTLRYLRPDGVVVWVEHHVTPLLDENGLATKLLCVCVDITERIHAETRLRDLNESLEQRVVTMLAQREKALAQLHESRKMEMVGQLSGGVAHDFNNLLTPIIASLELVRRRVTDERSTRLIDSALIAADRARTLVGRLLTFARRQTLIPEAIELEQLVTELRDLIDRSLGPMTTVQLDIPDGLPAVFIDPHQLELAILNLTVNARDALEDGGQVRISAKAEAPPPARLTKDTKAKGYVRLMVSDNGCGMDEDTLKHCVEPFYSTKGVGKGTGLGLSMVQGLALQSGGEFEISSQPGKGTDVTLWLPVASSPVTEVELKPVEPCPVEGSVHVLLVDDEELVRESTAHLLRDLGYQVTDTASAAAALELFDAGLRPDVLVTDYVMADINGIQLARQIRQRVCDLPILIITGYANAAPMPDDGFEILAKPFRLRDIATRLTQLLHGRS